MRSAQESNAIERVLKAWGLPGLNEPGIVETFARLVDDHIHLGNLLKACEPELRRDMYEAMLPHLRFQARPLEDYIIAAKQYAESAQLPRMDSEGNLLPYAYTSNIQITPIEIPEVELWLQCHKCRKESFFYTERRIDAIAAARDAGWGFDELESHHLCPNCLEAYALDEKTGQKAS